MGLLVLYGLIAVIVVNGIFYGTFVYLFFRGVRHFKRREQKAAIFCLVVSAFPIALFAGFNAMLAYEKRSRLAEVAALPRGPLSGSENIRSMVVVRQTVTPINSPGLIGSLIYAGVLDRVVFRGGDQYEVVEVFRAMNSSHCVRKLIQPGVTRSGPGLDLGNAVMARNAFHFCPVPEQDGISIDAPVWLYRNNRTPSGIAASGTADCWYANGEALELRWSADRGGELIEFQDIHRYRQQTTFFGLPLISPSLSDFIPTTCIRDYRSNAEMKNDRERLDPFLFVSRALGFNSIDDFPRLANDSDALEALRIMNEESPAYSLEAIILLLGQWPSTPEISRYIRLSVRNERVVKEVLSTMFDRRVEFELVPQLRSHASDFLAVCPSVVTRVSNCDHWKRLAQN